jgi:hypothetical protein
MTPRVVLEVHGIASRVAHGHRDEGVKTIGLDRLQWWWLAKDGPSLWSKG